MGRITKKKKKKPDRPRRQFGAVPFRVDDSGGLEIMLITSRQRGRWIVPKGWPKKAGARPTARAEAFEEAGLRGKVLRKSLGTFRYQKRLDNGVSVGCKLRVYPLAAKRQEKHWPEKGERKTLWFPVDEAITLCSDPGLGYLLAKLHKRFQAKRIKAKQIRIKRIDAKRPETKRPETKRAKAH